MMKRMNKKVLTLTVLATLSTVNTVWAQIATDMVTAANTLDNPYTAITVNQDTATKEITIGYLPSFFAAVGTDSVNGDVTLYVSDGTIISVSDDGSKRGIAHGGGSYAKASAVAGVMPLVDGDATSITINSGAEILATANGGIYSSAVNDNCFSNLAYGVYARKNENIAITLSDNTSISALATSGAATYAYTNAWTSYDTYEVEAIGAGGCYTEYDWINNSITNTSGTINMGDNTRILSRAVMGAVDFSNTNTAPSLIAHAYGIDAAFTAGENLSITASVIGNIVNITDENATIEANMIATGIGEAWQARTQLPYDFNLANGAEIYATVDGAVINGNIYKANYLATGIFATSNVTTEGITIKTAVDSKYSEGSNSSIYYAAQAVHAGIDEYSYQTLPGMDGNIQTITEPEVTGTVSINPAGGAAVVIEGDIYATENSTVSINLDTSSSYLQGNLLGAGDKAIIVSNGAAWQPVYDNRYGSYNTMNNVLAPDYQVSSIAIETLSLSANGIVDLTWDGWTTNGSAYDETRGYRPQGFRDLTIDSLSGDGGIIRIDSDLQNNIADTVTIGTESTATNLLVQVNYDDFYVDAIVGDSIIGSALVVTDNSGLLSVSGTISEYNEKAFFTTVEQDVIDNSKWNLTKIEAIEPTRVTENTLHANDSRKLVNSIWEIENNSLSKRVGNLRSMGDAIAATDNLWGYYAHGIQKTGDERAVEVQYNQFRLGYDKFFERTDGKIFRGIFVSRIDGDTSYVRGNGSIDSTTLGLYQVWLGDKGHYYDVVLRHGKINNDYDIIDLSGNYSKSDYGMWATTLSGEYGYRQKLTNGVYIEPNAELIFGYVGGADYTTSSDMDVYIDATRHAVTRLGFTLGKEYKQGSSYFKADYYHDFAGNGGVITGLTDYESKQAQNWYQLTLGADVRLNKAANMYFELRKQFGDYKSNLNFSIGARFTY